MSTGQERVGISFNPSGKPEVDSVKDMSAKIIDMLQPLVDHGGEAGRCAAVAQTRYEDAAMWAVKAITKP